jgi:uncharacterized protein YdbL (DUF1318 family)
MKFNRRAFIATLLALLILPASNLFAQDAGSKMQELQKRFKERFAAIGQLKAKGVVGETDEGYLDWVEKKDADHADLIEQENADRKELYTELAKKTKESPEVVAKHAAQRNVDKAKPGEFLKVDGKWRKKEG